VRRILAAISRKAASGPPLNLMPFDVERVVAGWRERQQRPDRP
jgi:hypothetical protein